MRAHWSYLKYVLRHKWFVFLSCWSGGVPVWRAIIHDWHKFLPSEWFPYVHTFYAPDGSKRYVETEAFNHAWNLHQKRGRHHWQFWLLTLDRGNTVPLEMPTHFAYEMVADWMGAGRAITGNWEAWNWYEKNRENIQLHENTRLLVETRLRVEKSLHERAIRLGIGMA